MNIIRMLNLLKKNCSAVACQCTCVPSTKRMPVVCAPVRVTVTSGCAWLFRHIASNAMIRIQTISCFSVGNLALLFLRLQYILNVFKFWSFVKSLSMPIESLLTTIFFLETKSLPSIPTKRYESEPNLPKPKLLLPNAGRFNRHCLSIGKTPKRQRSGKLTISSRLAGWSPRLC